MPVDTRFHSLGIFAVVFSRVFTLVLGPLLLSSFDVRTICGVAVSALLQQQNRNNNNVHVHDVAGEVASSSVAAENDYLFRPEVRQG